MDNDCNADNDFLTNNNIVSSESIQTFISSFNLQNKILKLNPSISNFNIHSYLFMNRFILNIGLINTKIKIVLSRMKNLFLFLLLI